jgi:hypothetical protein
MCLPNTDNEDEREVTNMELWEVNISNRLLIFHTKILSLFIINKQSPKDG